MHLFKPEVGLMGTSGIVGPCILQAAGAAYAFRILRTDRASVAFFGDGAVGNGAFHEGLNMAAIWDLPVLYVCENNQYALSTPLHESVGLPELSDRARGYGIPGVRVDGNDVLAVHAAAGEAVRRARAGEGPTLLDCLTYRFFGHFTGDKGHGITYRTKQEMEEWRARCPIVQFRRHLLDARVATDERLKEIELQVEAAIAAAAQYGLDSPWPAPEEAVEDVFA